MGLVEVPNEDPTSTHRTCILGSSHLPERWSEYYTFAQQFNGYEVFADDLPERANEASRAWA